MKHPIFGYDYSLAFFHRTTMSEQINLRPKEQQSDFVLLLTAALAAIYFCYLRFIFTTQFAEQATLDALVRGEAHTPFQARVLVPWIISALSRIIGQNTDIYLIARLIDSLALFSLIISFKVLLTKFSVTERAASLFSLLLFGILPYHFFLYPDWRFWYPFDIPAALFSCLGLLLIFEQKWGWFYLLFALATLNRETTWFLSCIFLLTQLNRIKKQALILHLGSQALIWIAIKYALYLRFAKNPGTGLFNLTLESNLQLFKNFQFYGILLSIGGFLLLPTIYYRRSIKNEFVQKALLAIYPYMLAMLFVGNLHETRIYCDLIPLIFTGYVLLITSTSQGANYQESYESARQNRQS